MIKTHPAYSRLKELAEERHASIHEGPPSFPAHCLNLTPKFRFVHRLTVLHDELEKLRIEEKVDSYTELTKDMHLYPDLHGKR